MHCFKNDVLLVQFDTNCILVTCRTKKFRKIPIKACTFSGSTKIPVNPPSPHMLPKKKTRQQEVHSNRSLVLPPPPPTGRPQPDVLWFINDNLVDNQIEQNTGNVIENRLLWNSVQRHHLHSVFTCKATNTKLVPPLTNRIELDMYRKYATTRLSMRWIYRVTRWCRVTLVYKKGKSCYVLISESIS